ncbi:MULTISPECIES: 2-amino-4-hydroxy-6-hydroxymethyldihydropteridine diphosphokinase [unclassified Aeromicrobium]|uniref:2-amino-4-hydroxy-6- hydroxymethyldihydropteridine diphosphokinase n=1 Tax=unclassified Aeromicrobium TaxID=2633570 RepID=UPI0006F663FC|nr:MULTISPECIES: 2-amino-4-hydroxy-6-hydroxymethyldihydropteridine diphosphokinase [unclassified Aeromicrobium]KQO36157.1 2-amino-4-hydroxy-6-hydroxymethyldihydropteridine pyrophosphokinase [Aeromicrobium sp. Leaf245]KQP27646.1 2-amino-4-hydroxy-6-hydroxymethyldihydropteridine pyrophosphokinase [Aeromicrobium sp. Leaf272]KQP78623.1 2-amino-4-hydroxy-6-hydroxymethyldihydropteridine pyrophosphokinase [Aeromicrobium sp. Leaf289]RYY44486.1 MAG: 2-amino-4-hydroxy-6-hydroxymethyldihydropteridine diph
MTESPTPYVLDADTMTGGMRPIRQAVIAIGSNLGDRLNRLQGAVSALEDTPEVQVVSVSSVYETEPVGTPDGSGAFLNAVVLLDTTLTVHTLLDRAHAIEDAFGRERSEPGAPRTLDVDLVVVGDRIADDETLTLPHPRAHERGFVLVPWLEIDPEGEIPGKGFVADLVGDVDTSGVVRREDLEILL